MKNILLLVLLFSISLLGFAQRPAQNPILTGISLDKLSQVQLSKQVNHKSKLLSQNTLFLPGLEAIYSWNTNSWQHMNDRHYTYDPNGNITEILLSNAGSGIQLRELYTYNASQQEVKYVYQIWNGTTWSDAEKIETLYDAFGNQLTATVMEWNGTGWDTTGIERHLYKYNSLNQVIEDVFMEWDSTWFPVRKIECNPAANGEWIDFTDYYWENNQWTANHHMKNIVWHDFSLLEPESYIMQVWDSSGWHDAEKYNATYSSGNNFVGIGQVKNSSGNWENQTRLTVNYDAQNNLVNWIYDIWMFTNWSFQIEQRNLYTYGSNQNLTEHIRQWRDFNNPATYSNDFKKVYSEFPGTTGVADPIGTITLAAWPNPVQSSLHIQLPAEFSGENKLELYDVMGRVLYSRLISSTTSELVELPVHQLPQGLYQVVLQSESGKASCKILKE